VEASVTLNLPIAPEANELLQRDPLALLLGMLLDQQVSIEKAFAGPYVIRERLGAFDAKSIAEADPEEFASMCAKPPAVHRYAGVMARRTQALCQALLDRYEGRAENIWALGDPDGQTVLARMQELPGFGLQKARIFVALLGKQYGVQPPGWREAAGPYGEEGSRRSVADVTDEQSLLEVRAYKKQVKAAANQG
jgi:uncharacterized HhH-GPD family protein